MLLAQNFAVQLIHYTMSMYYIYIVSGVRGHGAVLAPNSTVVTRWRFQVVKVVGNVDVDRVSCQQNSNKIQPSADFELPRIFENVGVVLHDRHYYGLRGGERTQHYYWKGASYECKRRIACQLIILIRVVSALFLNTRFLQYHFWIFIVLN